MKTFGVLCVTLVCSGAAAQSSYVLHHGDDGGWLECDETIDCRAIPGKRGVWFELQIAEEFVRQRALIPELEHTLQLQAQIAEKVSERLTLCQHATNLAVAEAHAAQAVADDIERELVAAREEAGAWYNSRLLWFGSGVGAAALILGGAILLAH